MSLLPMKKKVLSVAGALLLSSGFSVAGSDGDTVLICSVANPGVLAGLPHPPANGVILPITDNLLLL